MCARRSLPRSAVSRGTVMREPLSFKSNRTATEARGNDNSTSNLSGRAALVWRCQRNRLRTPGKLFCRWGKNAPFLCRRAVVPQMCGAASLLMTTIHHLEFKIKIFMSLIFSPCPLSLPPPPPPPPPSTHWLKTHDFTANHLKRYQNAVTKQNRQTSPHLKHLQATIAFT
jgi:hypothetical protein